MKLEIKRSKWLRGRYGSRLLNDEGEMCCLGFLCKTYGLDDSSIRNVTIPRNIVNVESSKLPAWLLLPAWLFAETKHGDALNSVEGLVNTNDASYDQMNEQAREADIIMKMACQGIEVTFVD